MKLVSVQQVRKFRILNEVMDTLQSIQPRTEYLDNLDAEVLDVFGDVGNLHEVFSTISDFYGNGIAGTVEETDILDLIGFIRDTEHGTVKYPEGWDDEKMTEVLNKELREVFLVRD